MHWFCFRLGNPTLSYRHSLTLSPNYSTGVLWGKTEGGWAMYIMVTPALCVLVLFLSSFSSSDYSQGDLVSFAVSERFLNISVKSFPVELMMISRVLQPRILSAGTWTPYPGFSYHRWGQPCSQAQLWARPREIWQGKRGENFHVSPWTFKAELSGGSHCLGSFGLQSPAWRCKNWRAASVLTILGWQGSNYALRGYVGGSGEITSYILWTER